MSYLSALQNMILLVLEVRAIYCRQRLTEWKMQLGFWGGKVNSKAADGQRLTLPSRTELERKKSEIEQTRDLYQRNHQRLPMSA